MKKLVLASFIALSVGSLAAAPSFADNHKGKGDKKCACGKDQKECKGCKKGECDCAKKEGHEGHGADDGHGHAAPSEAPKH